MAVARGVHRRLVLAVSTRFPMGAIHHLPRHTRAHIEKRRKDWHGGARLVHRPSAGLDPA